MRKKQNRKITFYEENIKRPFDFCCALFAAIVLSPVMFIIAFLVKVKLGSPVIFKQKRPGLNEKIFTMYKFRTMTDAKDENGNLLPDDARLTKFGLALRNSSLDELPELINILKGDLSICGPRPQLVRDMIFMSREQRQRHLVRPGLSGLAQINGRNAISWDDKLRYDLKYIKKITFLGDIKIILQTLMKAFVKREGINEENMATAADYGDYLLRSGKINRNKYNKGQKIARRILEGEDK